jgi:hypothetical protein
LKLFTAVRAHILLLAGLALLAGCAAVTTAEVPTPAPGPQIKAGLRAVMPRVIDQRYWPSDTAGAPNPNVHLFAPGITSRLRSGLIKAGLFAALPAPGQPSAAAMSDKLEITVTKFELSKLGNNAWAAPAYIVDGLVQPVSGGVLVATKGQVDTGAYLLPSTRVGTTLAANLAWDIKGIKDTVLKRSYLVRVELGAVSERQLIASLDETRGYGVKVGKVEGAKALDKLVQAIARDPHWLYLNSYIRLARARQVIAGSGSTPEARLHAARGLVGLLAPLAYTPAEAKILRDGVLPAAGRANVANDLRARYLGLSGPGALPAGQRVSEAQAAKLFNSPRVERSLAQAEVTRQAMELIMAALTPRDAKSAAQPKPAAASAPRADLDSAGGSRNPAPGPAQASANAKALAKQKAPAPEPLSPQARRLQAQLAAELAAALRGRVRLQAVFLEVADEAVGRQWPVAKSVLSQINSPQVKNYLAQREAS